MNIRLRLLGILLLVFMAVFFDFKNGGLRFEMLSGTCENYDFSSEKCFSGEQLNTVSMIPMYFDPPSCSSNNFSVTYSTLFFIVIYF